MTRAAQVPATSLAGSAGVNSLCWPAAKEHRADSALPNADWRTHAADGRPICCLSVDFEDFLHDLQRALGVSRPRQAPDSLWKAYVGIEEFARRHLHGGRVTFFTTGQVAREYPDIVRQIASDGHEIACHYYEHEQIWHQTRATFRENLKRAVEQLATISGQTVKGFRAPDFSIDRRCEEWAYEELSQFFVYDSSYVTRDRQAPSGGPPSFRFADRVLFEAPIFAQQALPGLEIRVIGGSFLRLLPLQVVRRLLRRAHAKGFLPHVYVHPYDLLHDYEQWSTGSDLAELTQRARIYWCLRQHQWHSIGNRSVFRKLKCIYQEFAHPGTLASLFEEYANAPNAAESSGGRSRADPIPPIAAGTYSHRSGGSTGRMMQLGRVETASLPRGMP